MITILTEKPAVAQAVAKCVGADIRKKGYLEGNGYYVTWLYGHILEMYTPLSEGEWKLSGLPIIPSKFLLREITDKDGKKPYAEQGQIIRTLLLDSTSAILATDAGREGELLGREVFEFYGFNKPFRRLWISSLTEEAITKGLQSENLRDGRSPEFENLYQAGKLRAEADWLVGINATRAFTLTANIPNTILSVGRVQTPVLRMICERYFQYKNFKPEVFWMLKGNSIKEGVQFSYRSITSFASEEQVNQARDRIMRARFIKVSDVMTERKTEQPPLLLDQGALQKLANARYGFTLDYTVNLTESLYLKQLVSYPRTGSRYISEDVFATVPAILELFHNHPVYGESAKALFHKPLNSRCVNDTKLTDHHALIVTGKDPGKLPQDKALSEDEAKIYDLILSRFIEAFSPVCVADITKVKFMAADTEFEARGRKEISLGWRGVNREERLEDVSLEDVDGIEMSMGDLPALQKGDNIPIAALQVVKDHTKPIPPFTDATIVSAMEKAGRSLDDKEGAKALKDIGIGTVATRAEILNTLIRRGYVERKGKGKAQNLIPTRRGTMVYKCVKDNAISSVTLTAKWEIALQNIADGRVSPEKFHAVIDSYTRGLTKEMLSGKHTKEIKDIVEEMAIKCPKCNKPLILTDKRAWCKDCDYTVWRTYAGKRLSDGTLEKLITKGETSLLAGFKKKNGEEFDAYLSLDAESGKVSFKFPKHKKF